MKKVISLGAAIALFAIAAIGCQNTTEGAKQDTAKNTEQVKEAADKAAVATEKAAKDTAEATKKAADRAESATEKASDRMVSATEKATKNAGEALTLTPKVKLALTNDAELNNTANMIDVDSKNGKVVLNGYVMTNEMKTRAEHIAKQTLKEAGATEQVLNLLSVKGKKGSDAKQ